MGDSNLLPYQSVDLQQMTINVETTALKSNCIGTSAAPHKHAPAGLLVRQSSRLLRAAIIFTLTIFSPAARAENNFTQGVEAYGAKNYSLALTKLADYLRKHPQDGDAHYYLALTYNALQRPAEAKREFEYILKAFPATMAARYSIQALSAKSAPAAPASAGSQTVAAASLKSNYVEPDEDRIPLRRSTGGHLMVRASVNNKPLEFAFDTGASTTCITVDAWKRLGNPAPKEAPTGQSSGVGGTVGTWSREAEIQLGKFKRTLPITILPAMPFDGLLGQTFFQDLQYNLSGNADYIHIFARGSKTALRSIPMDTIDIPFTKVGNNLLVTVKINGAPCPMFFDTGASNTLISATTASMLGLRPTGDYYVGQMSGVGATSQIIAFDVDSVALGDVVKRNVRISVGGPGVCLLGQNFFKDRHYVIDNEKGVIHFFR